MRFGLSDFGQAALQRDQMTQSPTVTPHGAEISLKIHLKQAAK